MRLYVLAVLALLGAVAVYGQIVPALLNAPSDTSVIAGVAIALLYPVAAYALYVRIR